MTTTYEISCDPRSPLARHAIVRLEDGDDAVESWVSFPEDPTRQSVEIFRSKESAEPFASVSGKRSARRVVGTAGEPLTVTAVRGRSVFRTVWAVSGPDGTTRLEMVERLADGLWRRVVRPLPKSFREGVPDLFGAILLSPLLLILKAKPFARLLVKDEAGQAVGSVRFACDARKPRDHFFVEATADGSEQILTAAVAAVSVMR